LRSDIKKKKVVTDVKHDCLKVHSPTFLPMLDDDIPFADSSIKSTNEEVIFSKNHRFKKSCKLLFSSDLRTSVLGESKESIFSFSLDCRLVAVSLLFCLEILVRLQDLTCWTIYQCDFLSVTLGNYFLLSDILT
jgi:hypothetical protein